MVLVLVLVPMVLVALVVWGGHRCTTTRCDHDHDHNHIMTQMPKRPNAQTPSCRRAVEAVGKWEEVLELSSSLESTRKQQGVEAACRGNIACACMSLDSPTKAIEHLGFALALCIAQGDKEGEALHSGNAGLAYRQLHQLGFAEAKVR